ncbi:hypothetical protein EMPG_16736 [Blastomyces silverae]|uniref:Sld7 C-terminal domain-containing protein n=1 Tax=Blastomyces silverae TaxID=2060906 RepID=A0A0H1B9R3_9EURO|nr:hypothetical protein EMPG_16736 [Blastomyces silverae]
MEVWSGPVTGAGDLSHGKGISLLVDPTLISHCALQKDARLSLRSFVNPTLIPYYARIGPALEVHIKDFKSIEWWKCRLLSGVGDEDEDADDRFDDSLPIQCPTGVLLAVETPQRRGSTTNTPNNDVTDILVYGVLGLPSLRSKRPPTPPPSSSPTFPDPTLGDSNDNEGSAPERELRIHAVTLCSGLIAMAEALPSPPLSPDPGSLADNNDDNDNYHGNDYDNETYAEFLPEQRSPCPKRKRMASIFDAATEYHKKVRRKGGEAVAQLMSRSLSVMSSSGHQLSNSAITKIKKEPLDISSLDKGNNINNNSNSSTHKPRMLSISRITKAPKQSSSAAPLSAHVRDSSTNTGARPRTASVSSWRSTPGPFAPQQQQQQDRQIPPPPRLVYASPSETISANKALLTRTILTCMRLYGFHRNSRTNNPAATSSQSKRAPLPESADVDSPVVLPTKTTMPTQMPTHAQTEKSSQSHSRPSTATTIPAAASPDADEDEDFKAMYHATYRAASFALRRYLKDVTNVSTSTGSSVVAGANGLNNTSSEIGGIGVPVLERGKATDLVDGVLRLFCET